MESSKALSVAGLLLIWLARTLGSGIQMHHRQRHPERAWDHRQHDSRYLLLRLERLRSYLKNHLYGTVHCQESNDTSQSNLNCSTLDKYTVEDDFQDVYLRCFTGVDASEPGKNSSAPFRQFTDLLNAVQFNNSRCLVVVAGGWNTPNNSSRILDIISGFLHWNTVNVCQLLWSSVTVGKPYEESTALGTDLAPLLAEVLDEARDSGVPCIHMLGYDLGAQLVGATSRAMKEKCERLIGVDPSGIFYNVLLNCLPSINEDDAGCVRILHTDAGGYGTIGPNGMIDFWPNGGSRPQPGCSEVENETPTSNCSHIRALDLTVEAVTNKSSIQGVLCFSWEAFKAGECVNDPVAFLDACNDGVTPGSYFFTTSDSYPFGEGIAGTIP